MGRRDREGIMPLIKGLVGITIILLIAYYMNVTGGNIIDTHLGDKGIEGSYYKEQQRLIEEFKFKEEKEYIVDNKEIVYETKIPYVMGEIEVIKINLKGDGEYIEVRVPTKIYEDDIKVGDVIKLKVGEDLGYMLGSKERTVYRVQKESLKDKVLRGIVGIKRDK